MTGNPLPPVKYALVCDDIREEKSNKVIIVGLYANKIIVEAMPTLLPKLAVRLCFDVSGPAAGRFALEIRRPDGVRIGPFPIVVPPAPSPEYPESCVNLNVVPFPLDAEGVYEIVACGGDGQEASCGRFTVETLRPHGTRLS